MTPEDYFKVLGLKPDATHEEIRKAYRSLARKYHPDLNPGDKSAEEQFKRISEAHDYLCDPNPRVSSKPEPPPKPVAEPASLDFGELYEDAVASLKFTIHNRGGKVRTEPILSVSNPKSWFDWQILSGRSDVEGYCPFEIEIAASGRRLKEINRPNEWVDIELDGVKTRIHLQARLRVRPTPKPKQNPSLASRSITYTSGEQKKEA